MTNSDTRFDDLTEADHNTNIPEECFTQEWWEGNYEGSDFEELDGGSWYGWAWAENPMKKGEEITIEVQGRCYRTEDGLERDIDSWDVSTVEEV